METTIKYCCINVAKITSYPRNNFRNSFEAPTFDGRHIPKKKCVGCVYLLSKPTPQIVVASDTSKFFNYLLVHIVLKCKTEILLADAAMHLKQTSPL